MHPLAVRFAFWHSARMHELRAALNEACSAVLAVGSARVDVCPVTRFRQWRDVLNRTLDVCPERGCVLRYKELRTVHAAGRAQCVAYTVAEWGNLPHSTNALKAFVECVRASNSASAWDMYVRYGRPCSEFLEFVPNMVVGGISPDGAFGRQLQAVPCFQFALQRHVI